jgi:hypothetical protein
MMISKALIAALCLVSALGGSATAVVVISPGEECAAVGKKHRMTNSAAAQTLAARLKGSDYARPPFALASGACC